MPIFFIKCEGVATNLKIVQHIQNLSPTISPETKKFPEAVLAVLQGFRDSVWQSWFRCKAF